MTLTITDTLISSDATHHTAMPVDDTEPYGEWWVSWLPMWKVDRNTAISAVSLAEIADCWNTPENFPLAATWAGELGMAVGEAVQMILADESGRQAEGTARSAAQEEK